ncbi:MAG: tRNA (adenosine(37)-N6)-threonylcarbamoyltransferase complex dimerization subunit type 1 TsaB [Candidatus Peribacteraceae bacterium]|jgi:tRNA threonylcarbamoyl adenosine modification protein YeaZ
MKCLYIDIASHRGLLACSDGKRIEAKMHCNESVRDNTLLTMYAEVMANAQWTHADLTHIACVTGPGGFTSLRIAVAFCNTLAAELGIPSAGIHLADVYAARAHGQSPLLWIHSTKKQEVFARVFGENREEEVQHMSLHMLLEHMPQKGYWCGELIPEHRAALLQTGLPEAVLQETDIIVPALVNEAGYDTNVLTPWYGREG